MKKHYLIITGLLTAGIITSAAVVHARGFGGCDHGFGDRHMSTFGGGGMGKHGHGSMRRMLRGLELTDEQRDKIFDIMHTQKPAVREKMKVLRKSHQELHRATMTDKYDKRIIRKLADTQAKTLSDLMVMRTETGNKIYKLLTPEQQKELAAQLDKWSQRQTGAL